MSLFNEDGESRPPTVVKHDTYYEIWDNPTFESREEYLEYKKVFNTNQPSIIYIEEFESIFRNQEEE